MSIVKNIFRILLFFCLLGSRGSGFCEPIQTQQTDSVMDIDDQILELEQLKRGYEAKALRHEDQAERLQFDHETWLEARRHMQLAEQNRQMAAKLQLEIERLKVRRLEILRQNGDNKLPPAGGDGFEDI